MRGAAPSVAVFQCSFSLGTSVMEVNVALYVMCECHQNRECVGKIQRGREREREREGCKHSQSNIWLIKPAQICPVELLKDQSLQRHSHL